MTDPDREYGLNTRAIHAGEEPDPATGALAPPIHLSTAFHLGTAEQGAQLFSGQREGFVYTRWGNPTQRALERRIAALEGAEDALATASGMAAIATAVLTAVKGGDHVVATKTVYSATYTLLAKQLPAYGVTATFVDATEPSNVVAALQENTRLVYLESPGNPTLALNDIATIADGVRDRAGQRGLEPPLIFVDNTFATPVNQLPLTLGADVVLHSATKYLCGHGDAIAGAIVGPAIFVESARKGMLRDLGGIISPFNAWLILRGIQTLPLRMERHNSNALAVARFLADHPSVEWVAYPGLESFPQHALARRQMQGFGAMIAFEVKGGVEAGRRLVDGVRLCTLAVSLGDTRTLITHAASTTHSTVPREARLVAGITDGLVRLSVGLEDAGDIISDLDQALAGFSA